MNLACRCIRTVTSVPVELTVICRTGSWDKSLMNRMNGGRGLHITRQWEVRTVELCLLHGRKDNFTFSRRNIRTNTFARKCMVTGYGASTKCQEPDSSKGGLPRFYVENLSVTMGGVVRVEGSELWHMARALRLRQDDRIELFDGRGGLLVGSIVHVSNAVAEVAALEDPRQLAPAGPQWTVAAACGTLKGGRADWMVEKCTELGAAVLVPILTERSPKAGEGRTDRWQRVALAAAKQSQRLHGLRVEKPQPVVAFLSKVAAAPVAFLAAAGGTPLLAALRDGVPRGGGLILVGPEGDFTAEEMLALEQAGALKVGLGPRRLRVETAAIAMLAGLMLAGDGV